MSLNQPSSQVYQTPQPSTGATRGQGTALVLLLLIVAAAAVWHTVLPQRWDYMITSIPDAAFDTQMHDLGTQGWELVTARRATSDTLGTGGTPTFSYEGIFKRPRAF